jgi:DNA-binding XRE family transcriptional regulator
VNYLTDGEQAHVRAALRFLRTRSGGWEQLAKVLGFSRHTVRHVRKGEKAVSPNMAFRVSRLAMVPLEDVLTGKYPAAGTCPACGHGPVPQGRADLGRSLPVIGTPRRSPGDIVTGRWRTPI